MRSHWITAALLTTVITAGCNGRNDENAQNTGQNQAAEELIRRAIAIQPQYAQAHGNLGIVLTVLGRFDELADGTGGSVDAAMGAAIGPYRESRVRP